LWVLLHNPETLGKGYMTLQELAKVVEDALATLAELQGRQSALAVKVNTTDVDNIKVAEQQLLSDQQACNTLMGQVANQANVVRQATNALATANNAVNSSLPIISINPPV
jgi:hypothetical protein